MTVDRNRDGKPDKYDGKVVDVCYRVWNKTITKDFNRSLDETELSDDRFANKVDAFCDKVSGMFDSLDAGKLPKEGKKKGLPYLLFLCFTASSKLLGGDLQWDAFRNIVRDVAGRDECMAMVLDRGGKPNPSPHLFSNLERDPIEQLIAWGGPAKVANGRYPGFNVVDPPVPYDSKHGWCFGTIEPESIKTKKGKKVQVSWTNNTLEAINGWAVAIKGNRGATTSGKKGSLTKKKRFRVPAGRTKKVTLRLSRKGKKALNKIRRRGKKLRVTIKLNFKDDLGERQNFRFPTRLK